MEKVIFRLDMENILPMVFKRDIFPERHLRAERAGICANLIAPAASPFPYHLFILFRLGYARFGDFLPPGRCVRMALS